jgi:hypothetical protein
MAIKKYEFGCTVRLTVATPGAAASTGTCIVDELCVNGVEIKLSDLTSGTAALATAIKAVLVDFET